MAFSTLVLALLACTYATLISAQSTCSRKCNPDGSNCSNVCPPSDCSARVANMGGQVMVLDAFSLIPPEPSWAYFPPGPADCCQQCKDTDSCNAWAFCNNPAGCGSDCSAYVAKNPGTTDIMSPRPLLKFGQFKTCLGTRWPAYTCTLRRINDTQKPPLVASQSTDGWVSGVTNKPTLQGCPKGTSQLTCSTCRATKDPATCLSCTATASRPTGVYACAVCANLQDPAAKATCVRCTAPGPGQRPGLCHDCMSYDNPADNMTAIQQCFSCVAKSSSGKGSQCPACFHASPSAKQQATCNSCVQSSTSSVLALACSYCNAPGVSNSTRCRSCAAKAKNEEGVVGCAACLQPSAVPAQWAQACMDCVTKAAHPSVIPSCYSLDFKSSTAKSSSTQRTATTAISNYYGCLAGAKSQGAAAACSNCFQAVAAGKADATGCYSCAKSVPTPATAQYCGQCWSTSNVAQAVACQSCLASIPSQLDPAICWASAAITGSTTG